MAGARAPRGGPAGRLPVHEVLRGVDVSVGAGTVFALLGPHGAGKTTTLSILSTLLHPDGGTASVAGRDVVREPARVCASITGTGQSASVDPVLTTQHMEEAATPADHIAVLHDGRITAIGGHQDIVAAGKADNLEDAFLHLTGPEPRPRPPCRQWATPRPSPGASCATTAAPSTPS